MKIRRLDVLDLEFLLCYFVYNENTEVLMSKTMVSARIPEDLGARIEELAESTKRSKAYILNEALEIYVAQRAWMIEEIELAKREANESGAFISQDAMERWADSLVTDVPLPMPEPNVFKRKRA
jgi:RHH-type transcriptional regulator, rel operon repressor / antitoxin RelB